MNVSPESSPSSEEKFRTFYAASGHPALRELERRVLGVDYGGNSYTDVGQANTLISQLELGPASSLLDVGAGAGWPGVFMAKESGCRVVMTDVPLEGLHTARGRAIEESIDAVAVAASGTALPFADEAFDGIVHSDVLC